jgi:hypothetical protein
VGSALLAVERGADCARNWPNLCPQLLLYSKQGVAVLVCEERNSEAAVSKAAATTDAMQVRLRSFRHVKVDDHIDGLDVDTAREEIG